MEAQAKERDRIRGQWRANWMNEKENECDGNRGRMVATYIALSASACNNVCDILVLIFFGCLCPIRSYKNWVVCALVCVRVRARETERKRENGILHTVSHMARHTHHPDHTCMICTISLISRVFLLTTRLLRFRSIRDTRAICSQISWHVLVLVRRARRVCIEL